MKKLALIVSIGAFALPLLASAQVSGMTAAAAQADIMARLQAIQLTVLQLRASSSATTTGGSVNIPLQQALDSLLLSLSQASSSLNGQWAANASATGTAMMNLHQPDTTGLSRSMEMLNQAFSGNASSSAGLQNALNRHACIQLSAPLRRGFSGGDVTALQTFLSTLPSIYPEGLVTGTFGPKTEQAVARFQASRGFEQTGTVGPLTRQAIRDATCGSE